LAQNKSRKFCKFWSTTILWSDCGSSVERWVISRGSEQWRNFNFLL